MRTPTCLLTPNRPAIRLMTDWHDHLLAAGVVPVAPYNVRSTDDSKDIEYRAKDRIEQHSEDAQLNQSTLDETYNRRTGVI